MDWRGSLTNRFPGSRIEVKATCPDDDESFREYTSPNVSCEVKEALLGLINFASEHGTTTQARGAGGRRVFLLHQEVGLKSLTNS